MDDDFAVGKVVREGPGCLADLNPAKSVNLFIRILLWTPKS